MNSRSTFTVQQFCDEHHVSRTFFYALLREGKGPRLMRLGRRVLIGTEAASDWRREREVETARDALAALEQQA